MIVRAALACGMMIASLTFSGTATAQGTATTPTARAPGDTTGNATQRPPSAAQEAQQRRMRECNTQAGTRNLTGDARRSFMSNCLSGR